MYIWLGWSLNIHGNIHRHKSNWIYLYCLFLCGIPCFSHLAVCIKIHLYWAFHNYIKWKVRIYNINFYLSMKFYKFTCNNLWLMNSTKRFWNLWMLGNVEMKVSCERVRIRSPALKIYKNRSTAGIKKWIWDWLYIKRLILLFTVWELSYILCTWFFYVLCIIYQCYFSGDKIRFLKLCWYFFQSSGFSVEIKNIKNVLWFIASIPWL
jgi:hypothetical protein